MGRNRDDDFFGDDLFNDDDDAFNDAESRLSFDDDDSFDQGDDLDDFDLGDGDDINLDDDEEEETSSGEGGPSRTFIILAVIMIILFVLGLGVLLFALSRPTGPTPFDLTATSIVETNVARQALIDQTLTAQAEALNLTATATLFTATPTPTHTFTPSPTFTETPSPTASPTESIGPIGVNTPTEEPSPTQEDGVVGPTATIGRSAVEQTATALAQIFSTPIEQVTATPAVGGATSGGATTGGALPDTGLFDDLAGGGMGTFVLIAIGLVGVIVVARGLRVANRKR